MADTVDVQMNKGTAYTWKTSPFMWKDAIKSWKDASPNQYTVNRLSYVSIAEKSHRHQKLRKIKETLHIAEHRKIRLRILLYEKIRTTETYWDNIKFNLHVLEMFQTVDGILRKFKLIPSDYICFADKSSRKATIKRRDGLKLTDEFLHQAVIWLGVEENIKAIDNALKNYESHYRESIKPTETHNRYLSKNRREPVQLKEAFNRLYIIRKTIKDDIEVAEQFKKQYSLQERDSFTIYDAFIKACEAVLSNLAIRYGELDDEGFMKLVNAPSGYTDFTDFKVGEYEYEEALVRIVLETKVPQFPASVADVVLHVDIPDTDDRGITQITDTAAATKVHFNKHYYNPPEVNVVLRAGSTANSNVVPYIVSTDGQDDVGRYFEVELIAANGERTTGTISWVSKGY
jgi:hypothetical protein